MNEKQDWCHCGLPVKDKWGYKMCPKHGIGWRYEPIKPPKRDRIGKYSGKSKTPYGKYEDR